MHCPHRYQHPPSVIEPRSPGLQAQSLGQVDCLEKEIATQSNILAWKIPRTEDPGRVKSMGLQKSQG